MAKKAATTTIEVDVALGLSQISSDVRSLDRQLQQSFSNISRNIERALTVGGAIAGIAVLSRSITGLGNQLIDLAKAGETAGSVRDQFIRLGGSVDQIELARKATLGMVDSFDLMAKANDLMIAGIPEAQTRFAEVAEMAARLSDATGMELTAAFGKVGEALKSASSRSLIQLGIMIDEEAAYERLANAIGKEAKELTAAEKVQARRAAALDAMGGATDRLGAMTDSAANAYDAFQASLGEAYKTVGIAINESPELTEALRDLAEMVDSVDWQAFGKDIAAVIATISDAVTTGIPMLRDYVGTLTDLVSKMPAVREALQVGKGAYAAGSLAVDLLSTTDLEETERAIERLETQLANERQRLTEVGGFGDNSFGAALTKDIEASINSLGKQIVELETTRQKLLKESKDDQDDLTGATNKGAAAAGAAADKLAAAGAAIKRSADEAKQSWEDLNRELDVTLQATFDLSGRSGFSWGAPGSAGGGFSDLVSSILHPASEEWTDLTQINMDVWKEEWKHATDESVDYELAAHKEAVDQWQTVFENAISGTALSMSDMMLRLGSGFAAGAAAAIYGAGPDGGMQGAGQALGEYVFGDATGQDTLDALDSAGGAYAIQASIDALLQLGQSTEATAKALTTGAGAGIGGYFGGGIGAAIGASIGQVISAPILALLGEPDPERMAREAAENWFEDQLKASEEAGYRLQTFTDQGLQDFGTNVRMDQFGNFTTPGWADQDKAQNAGTFAALGQGFEEFLGVTEEVGAQIGIILQTNLLDNLDNARMFLQAMGVSVEELGEALFQAAKRGEITWQEFAVHMQGLNQLAGEGLVGVGDLSGAYAQLEASGGRGMNAIIAAQNIAIEATELGITTVDELGQQMVAAGIMSAAEWEEFGRILKEHGIDTMEELAGATEQTLGGIIADVDSNVVLFEEWNEQLAESEEHVQGIADSWKEVPAKKVTQYIVNVQVEGDPLPDELESPVDDSGGNDSGGKKPKKANKMSSRVRSAKLNNVNVTINAPNATPGMESRILNVVQTHVAAATMAALQRAGR